jgi:hypothetical protein
VTGIVLDYSDWRPPSPQALKAAGVTGVMRYIAPAVWGWPKAITPGELAGLIGAGIAVGFNFEKNPGDWRGGHGAGMVDGSSAAQAMRELRLGAEIPVFPSFDEEVMPGDFPTAVAYEQGFHEQCGHARGAYGEGALLEALAVTFGWESESTSFPGNQSPTVHTVLVQHFGQQLPGLPGAYDVNTVVKADWGQYPRPTAPVPPKPSPAPVPQTGGISFDMGTAKHAVINVSSAGQALRQFFGVYDAGGLVAGCQVSMHGPDPHQADPSSPDDYWPGSIGATPRAQARGNHVVVTVDAPNWRPGMPMPSVNVTAILA